MQGHQLSTLPLSQEEISALFEELPFQVSPSDNELPEDSVCPSLLNYRTVPHPRSSTAFSTLRQADVTTREPLDISLDSSSESLVYPSVRETASPTNPSDSPEFDPADLQSFVYRTPQQAGPARIALQVENISDSDDLEEPREGEENQQKSMPSQPPVINSPADLVKLVHRRESSDGDSSSDSSSEFSVSEEEVTSSSSETPEDSNALNNCASRMATGGVSDLPAQAIQRLCEQLKDAVHSSEPTPVKPAIFHGYENENVDRWLQRFALYLATKRLRDDSPQAAIQLALHLSGPAESFYYNLPSVIQGSYTDLRDALKERFAPAHRSLRLRQALSVRRQGTTETIEKFLADLNEKFSCLDLRDEDKLSYLVQGLRPDIQAEVLKKEPKTYAEAEDAARLLYSIQQALSQRREEDITRLVQQTASLSSPSASLIPTNTTADSKKLIEQNNAALAKIEALSEKLGIFPATRITNIAAIDDYTSVDQRNLLETVEKMEDKLINLIQDLDRRVDARITGLARRQQATRSDPTRERTRDGRPVCFTCGRVGHLQTSCPERRNRATQATPQQPQQSHRPNSNYNQPRDNYRNYSQTNRREQRLAVLDDDLYDEEFVGHLTPSNSEPMYFARRSTPLHRENNVISAIKPSRRQRMVRCPTNLHEKVATQHAVMSPSNRKPQQAKPSATVVSEKFPAPNNNQATPEPITDQGSDASNIPVEFKPAFDLFVRAIKQSQPTTATEDKTLSPQIVNIPNATTAQPIGTEVEDCVDEISSDLDQGSLNAEALQVQDCTPNKEMSQRGDSLAEQVWVSTATRSSPGKVQKRLPHSDASLHSSDLTISGVIAGEAVQLLVDTGACLSVIDEQFLQKIYGPFSPKMTDGILPSIQTVNGERVPVLGKITVPIELNGCEFVCDFHVMQNLAYDAILGRDFLQQNRALIDLDNNNITFKRSKDAKKTRQHTSSLPVLGTFFSPTTSVGRQTSTKVDLEPRPKMHSPNGVQESQNGNRSVSHYSLLLWVCFVLYLLAASPTVMQEIKKPAVQTAQKSYVFHDAMNENADRGYAGVSVNTIGSLNHKEPYKVTQDNHDAPKSHREPFKTTQTAAEIFKDSKFAVPAGVRIQEETTLRDLVHERLITVAQDLPKDELKIKPSPTLNV